MIDKVDNRVIEEFKYMMDIIYSSVHSYDGFYIDKHTLLDYTMQTSKGRCNPKLIVKLIKLMLPPEE